MIIQFKKAIPNPMLEDTFTDDSLWNSNVELDTNEYHFISSNSGKGKSSLLAFIYGTRVDYAGEIIIDGKNQKEISLADWAELRTQSFGYLAQDLRLFPDLTVYENLQIKNRLTNHKTKEEISEMMESLELGGRLEQKAGTLSLGQQQRTALVRSMLQPFDFLLLDEPFSNIDEHNIKIAIELIKRECALNKAGFIITTLGYDYGMKNKVIKL